MIETRSKDLSAPITVTTTAIRECRLMGLMYSYGQMEFQGVGDVYGALYAERGFVSGTAWSVYYNARLAQPQLDISCALSFPPGPYEAAEGDNSAS